MSYNRAFNPPKREQAVDLLLACRSLCERLVLEKLVLHNYDLVALMGYQQVVLGGWDRDPEVLDRAGISASDLTRLAGLVARSKPPA
jgi:hypothetical protein